MRTFDATTLPLAGPRLVEASAGTGKTHAITTLVVRLVVERGLSIEDILVVTFTEAATAELRARIRKRLRTALVAAAGEETDDVEVATIVRRHPDARSRLAVALTNIDRAAVHTIHGFCHRTLLDSAFDSGARFDVELLTETQGLLDEVLFDFWTERLAGADPGAVRSLRRAKVSPNTLGELVRTVTRAPSMPIVGVEGADLGAPDTGPYARAFAGAREAWDRERVERLLVESAALHRNKYRAASVRRWCDQIHSHLTRDDASVPIVIRDGLEKLTPAALADGVKKGYAGKEPRDPFFVTWERVVEEANAYAEAANRHALSFKLALSDYARRELPRRKDRLGVMGFDDLLHALHDALRRPTGARLAAAVRRRHPVALIDEFQDTDPTQWSIFRRIYGEGDMVLIGDPKQAIYAFRGADVFAYLDAARHVPDSASFTMTVSWRSDPTLLAAVGSLYSRSRSPFAIADIRHVEVEARPGANDEIGGAAPLSILFVRREEAKRRVTGERLARLPDAVAAHIQRTISEVEIAGEKVRPADIAVLTRTNKQAFEMQRALGALGVHSVVLGDQSVFEDDQPEARELSLVLAAIAEPTHSTALRSALATELLGVSAAELARMEQDEQGWDEWVDRFRRLSELWHGRGFVQMFRALLRQTNMVERLLGLERGERRVTNLLHLMELLQTAASSQHLGPAALLAWLAASRRPETAKNRPEATQIRLESDAHAVRITTVHRSKGLEYPIVYCPSLWDGTLLFSGEKANVVFHRPDDAVLALDLAGHDDNVSRAEHERFAENLRLMYVALTRAKHHTVVVWGALGRNYETSPLGYLLHAPPLTRGEPTVAEVKSHVVSLDDARMLSEVAAKATEGMSVEELDLDAAGVGVPERAQAKPELRARVAKVGVMTWWRTASFSELTADRRGGITLGEGRDRDASWSDGDPAVDTDGEPITLERFPRGAKAGDFFHDVLEHLDFADPAALEPLVVDRLRAHGFAATHSDDVVRGLREMLDTKLPTGRTRGMRLRDVRREDRLDELEFYFPVANPSAPIVPRGGQLSLSFSGGAASAMTKLSAEQLAQPFADHPSDELEPSYAERVRQLGFLPLEGFLKGYIDLVFQHAGRFYVVDYKSNHLGDHLADYGAENLRRAMSRGHYYLQAHLYAVAVHRLLARRMPKYRYDKSFGGVLYLFLKGMRPGSSTGVFFEKPPRERIRALSDVLDTPPQVRGRR